MWGDVGDRWSQRRAWARFTDSRDEARAVLGAGALMIAAFVGFRAWVLYPSWFFLDDYNLINDALAEPISLEYLLTPYNNHLMPGGRAMTALIAEPGNLDWTFAATIVLVVQACAAVAALWMMTSLFGVRWAILAPFAVYLTSAVTVPAMLWWAAAVNQVPLQLTFFLAVGAWVHYLRSRRWGWLLVTVLAVSLGLLFYVKALLVLPVLAYLALAYFASGGLVARVKLVLSSYWPAAALGAVIGIAYTGYYMANVSQPLEAMDWSVVPGLTESMLGSAFIVGALGGPWRWSALSPPTAYANPPMTAVQLATVVVVLVVLYAFLHRERTLRAWALLGGYLIALLALLVSSRAPEFGRSLGLEYRYLTDAACVVALSLGLAFLPVRGAAQPSAERAVPLLRPRPPRPAWVAGLLLVCAGGVYSSVIYTSFWHSDNASRSYLAALSDDLRNYGAADLVDLPVPDAVMSQLAAPHNTTGRLAPLVSQNVSFPALSSDLLVVDDAGRLQRAAIQPGVFSKPGPDDQCGWRVESTGRSIPLAGRAFSWTWWVRIGYLASESSSVRVTAGLRTYEAEVRTGLNDLYLRVDGSFESLWIDGLAPGAALCVDTIEVGQPIPGGRVP